ncbi:MAG: hypothetical protein ACFFEE_05610 [Candidatus Thorarchaeota archaeon]
MSRKNAQPEFIDLLEEGADMRRVAISEYQRAETLVKRVFSETALSRDV